MQHLCSTTPANETIPFLDLAKPHRALRDELLKVVAEALDSASFVGGPMVSAFETEFAAFCRVKNCVGVASGTDALRFALTAVGVRPETSVITVPNTFVATAASITQAGGAIEFVDVDSATCLIDANRLDDHLRHRSWNARTTPRPVAIVPVHLYGQCADMDAINELAQRYELKVVEDAAQAHGAQDGGRPAGSLGHAAAFSFYPGKNLGACGEGGAVTTNDPVIAEHVGLLRDHGRQGKHQHVIEGYNGRLHAIQAGILSVKLRSLESANALRRERAAQYDSAFTQLPWLKTISLREDCLPARHLYVIRAAARDHLREALQARNIGSGIHYPTPLHLQPCYRRLGLGQGTFPVAEKSCREVLSLPLYPELGPQSVDSIIAVVRHFGSTREQRPSAELQNVA